MPLEAVSPWPSWRSLLRLAPEPFLTTRREPRQPESLIAEPAQVFGYPFHKSTAEVYRSETKEFRPQYARVRGTLDYTYHFSPTLARQRVQDRIIEEALSKGEASDEPWLLFTAGGMGAGKSWSMKRLSLKGYFRQTSFVRVDPDDLRTHLPEYSRYLLHDAMTAGQKTHEEASLMTEIAVCEALKESKHVLVDSSLRDWEWYKQCLLKIRRKYPKRKIGIIYVEADRQLVYDRARARALKTGRIVPHHTIDAALDQVPVSVEKLKELTDYTATIVNNPDELLLKSGDTCWAAFKARW
eukprot:CAMPEP_0118934012 /NCGR_PEP_ID=MMETSP1169-20130426/13320_1 /TAXON_ID=36882 /ORGANISM="Pyramimonas obovata, Strain CCMP722" /LENGTH=297 /DNA_ID=CAMNT_0006876865 /DNA_START=393 /DNA_END=1283 /DNA_ORIENTATION=+